MEKRKKPYKLSEIKLPPIIESWLLYAEASGRPDGTLASYRTAARQFVRYVQPEDPATLSSHDIHLWILDMRRAGYADASMNSRFQIIRGFYKWLVREKERTDNPTDGIQRPGDVGDRVPRGLTDAQVVALLDIRGNDFQSRRDLAILSVFVDTGMRHSEIHALTVDDADTRQGYITVKGKGRNRSRTTVAGKRARLALDRYLRVREKHPYAHRPHLWLGLQGPLGYASFSDIVLRHGKRIGIEGMHPHMLRHTWASKVRKAGLSEGDLLVLGGWRSRAMLDLYGKFEAAERAVDAYRANSFLDSLR